jgi:hypothetical protein
VKSGAICAFRVNPMTACTLVLIAALACGDPPSETGSKATDPCPNVAVVTVDSMGQPRVRTTKAFLSPVDAADPAMGVTVWIMTRLTTRKVDQMRRHALAWRFWRSRPDITVLAVGAVQALFGLLVAV